MSHFFKGTNNLAGEADTPQEEKVPQPQVLPIASYEEGKKKEEKEKSLVTWSANCYKTVILIKNYKRLNAGHKRQIWFQI